MKEEQAVPGWKDKILFTPGPLTTSRTVKQVMLRDLGSRDYEFIGIIRDVRRRLVAVGEASEDEYTTVLVQGAGTFGLESVISSTIPEGKKLLVAINGAYGRRVVKMAEMLRIPVATLEYPATETPRPADIEKALAADPEIFQVSMCHCETTSGILNPIREVGEVVRAAGRTFFVDAMSAFGAVPTSLPGCHIDFLCSSANKCIEGVPGFSFVLARIETLKAAAGRARSLSLDLHAQWQGLEKDGQFRFTPPVHAIMAYQQALKELELEGGVAARAARYRRNNEVLREGMRRLGFREYLRPEVQGYIITSFHSPDHPNWSFERFYELLNRQQYVIYPGKVGNADCFRIGSIGRIFENDVRDLLSAIERVLAEMKIDLPRARG